MDSPDENEAFQQDAPSSELEQTTDAPESADPAPPAPKVNLLARLRYLPVQISVRLAEKRIPMSQLMNISPGMLIPFNKSCDDLLDLYVNNAQYCRGEAVKIGEKFGLKINEVGIKADAEQKVIEA